MKIIIDYNTFILESQQEVQSTDITTPIESEIQTEIQTDSSSSMFTKISKIVDYTSIKQDLIKENIKQIVDESIQNGFYGICVNPEFVDYVVYELEDSNIKVISTLDYPNGKSTSTERLNEVMKVISDGVDEIDLSIDIDEFKKAHSNEDEDIKSSTYLSIEKDIKNIASECHKNGVILKVIIESGILSFDELKDICLIVSKSNADYIQTSSGSRDIGAEIDKVKEIKRIIPEHMKIKVSGGIRTLEEANKFYPYCDRIGTSSILK